MTDKPLHVRVAEALGWSHMEATNGMWPDEYWGYPPIRSIIGQKEQVPNFTIDWSATGPLIEKYHIQLESDSRQDDTAEWDAMTETEYVVDHWQNSYVAEGATPLLAVCHLILALKEAGKLTP